jgi:tetratricopeptide (TPR) repeat protein
MKITYLLLLFNFLFISAYAQVVAPQPSPKGTLTQVVGLTTVSVDYSRPSARGRKIMGGIVRYGDLWRTGANLNTIVSFSDDVTVGGKDLPAGKYGLYTRPQADQWEIYFYKKYNIGGIPKDWEEDQVALTITVPAQNFQPMVETFTISFSDLNSNGALLNLIWEHTLVSIPLEVPTRTKTLASIQKTLSASPKAGDYFQAAVYYLQERMDLDTAQEWMEKALEMNPSPAYWMYRQYALILKERNNKEGALKAAKRSLELAEKAGNKDYVIMNRASISEWSQ